MASTEINANAISTCNLVQLSLALQLRSYAYPVQIIDDYILIVEVLQWCNLMASIFLKNKHI